MVPEREDPSPSAVESMLVRNKAVAPDCRAAAGADAAGLGWETAEMRMVPAPKLNELLQRSRKAAASAATE